VGVTKTIVRQPFATLAPICQG